MAQCQLTIKAKNQYADNDVPLTCSISSRLLLPDSVFLKQICWSLPCRILCFMLQAVGACIIFSNKKKAGLNQSHLKETPLCTSGQQGLSTNYCSMLFAHVDPATVNTASMKAIWSLLSGERKEHGLLVQCVTVDVYSKCMQLDTSSHDDRVSKVFIRFATWYFGHYLPSLIIFENPI